MNVKTVPFRRLRIIILLFLILAIILFLIIILLHNKGYTFKCSPYGITKIVYCTNTNISPQSREYITVTDKGDISRILSLYRGLKFKPYQGKSAPDGFNPDIDVYGSDGKALSFSSAGIFLYKGNKFYTNFSLDKEKQNQLKEQAVSVFNGHK